MPDLEGEATFTRDIWIPGVPQRAGFARLVIMGHASAVTTQQTVGPIGGLYVWTAITAKVDVVSASTNDTSAGSGMRKVRIYGLDANLAPISETLTLNGTTPVASALSYFRVNHVIGDEVGTYGGSNVGIIGIVQQTSSVVMASIQAGEGSSHNAVFTVPAGYHAFVHGIHLSATSTKDAVDFQWFCRLNPQNVSSSMEPSLTLGHWLDVTGSIERIYKHAAAFSEGTDFWVTAKRSGSTTIPACSVEIDLTMFPVGSRGF